MTASKPGLICEFVVTEGRSPNGWLIVNCGRHGWGYTGPEEDALATMAKHIRARGKDFVSEPRGAADIDGERFVVLGERCPSAPKDSGIPHTCVGNHERGFCDSDIHRCTFCGKRAVERRPKNNAKDWFASWERVLKGEGRE